MGAIPIYCQCGMNDMIIGRYVLGAGDFVYQGGSQDPNNGVC